MKIELLSFGLSDAMLHRAIAMPFFFRFLHYVEWSSCWWVLLCDSGGDGGDAVDVLMREELRGSVAC